MHKRFYVLRNTGGEAPLADYIIRRTGKIALSFFVFRWPTVQRRALDELPPADVPAFLRAANEARTVGAVHVSLRDAQLARDALLVWLEPTEQLNIVEVKA